VIIKCTPGISWRGRSFKKFPSTWNLFHSILAKRNTSDLEPLESMYNPGSFIIVRQDKKVMNDYIVKAMTKYFGDTTGEYLKKCRRTNQPLEFDAYIESLSKKSFLKTWNSQVESLKNSYPDIYLAADLTSPYDF
jgi:hypothetical protein